PRQQVDTGRQPPINELRGDPCASVFIRAGAIGNDEILAHGMRNLFAKDNGEWAWFSRASLSHARRVLAHFPMLHLRMQHEKAGCVTTPWLSRCLSAWLVRVNRQPGQRNVVHCHLFAAPVWPCLPRARGRWRQRCGAAMRAHCDGKTVWVRDHGGGGT